MQSRCDPDRIYGPDVFRTLRCPRCGHRLVDVAAGTSGSIRIKCRKCKFQGVLDLARFRKQRRAWRRSARI
ncbi:MAG: hypothetical protein J6P39_02810 [Oscillospiraceae bacterium]|nr:hypothetical protein [Oscillospiraceae bacterium]